MADPIVPSPARRLLLRAWPWVAIALVAVPAVWHAIDFPEDLDLEYPRVVRPTFSAAPPPAYRLAEPGDTIDRIAVYVSALAVVLSLTGLVRDRRRPWVSALGLSLAAFWYAANPGPTFDGWHGLAWSTILDPLTPADQRSALAAAACLLTASVSWGVSRPGATWRGLWAAGRAKGVAGLMFAASALTVARQFDLPGVEPTGYWPRWAFVAGLVAFSSALIRLQPPKSGTRANLTAAAVGAVAWSVVVLCGVWLSWYHRPIDRLRTVVPGRIYMSAMPTARGLEVAQSRHHFKTVINLFPEDTPFRSPRLPEELKFVETHGIRYFGSPSDVASSNAFLDLTLRLAQDPEAWPVLVHCHGCMDRTPAWVGIYRFVVEGRPLDEIFRFIEGHRGYRPKASVTLLYNRVLPRLAPEHFMEDPTAALLHRCAEGTADPYFEQLRSELARANREEADGVSVASGSGGERSPPSLTPRR